MKKSCKHARGLAKHDQVVHASQEDMIKPVRWDTHSWLPLLPASGLLVTEEDGSIRDVLGFTVEAAGKQEMVLAPHSISHTLPPTEIWCESTHVKV